MRHISVQNYLPPKLSMIIPIKSDGEIEEWAIIELQGDLKFNATDVIDKYIADLHFTKSDIPILIIGIHTLHGKRVKLSKPFAVIVKKHNESYNTTNTSEVKTEYNVKAIITEKLLFRSRPKSIATYSSKDS